MSQKASKFWVFAFPVSLVVLAGAYYIKVPAARQFIDQHTSLGHKLFGSFVHDGESFERRSAPSSIPSPSVPGSSSERREVAVNAAPTPVPVFDLQKLASDASLRPKKVSLKRETSFPAVVSGKVVGSIVAPVGSEVNLMTIKDGKIGVEYQGGGAWLAVEDTDLERRVMGH